MPHLGQIKRKDLVYYLKQVGFEGPYSSGKHQFMIKGNLSITIPNPHKGDIGVDFLVKILIQAKVSTEPQRFLHSLS